MRKPLYSSQSFKRKMISDEKPVKKCQIRISSQALCFIFLFPLNQKADRYAIDLSGYPLFFQYFHS